MLACMKQGLHLLLQVDLKTSNGSTALHNAANCGHAAVVKQLLQAGAGVGQCALTGANALFNAATAGLSFLLLSCACMRLLCVIALVLSRLCHEQATCQHCSFLRLTYFTCLHACVRPNPYQTCSDAEYAALTDLANC